MTHAEVLARRRAERVARGLVPPPQPPGPDEQAAPPEEERTEIAAAIRAGPRHGRGHYPRPARPRPQAQASRVEIDQEWWQAVRRQIRRGTIGGFRGVL